MSYYDYRKSQEISLNDYPFAALIMAAMRKADTHNQMLLGVAFPRICAELAARCNALGGHLPEDGEDA